MKSITPFSYNNIVFIGAGGTGSHQIPDIIRAIMTHPIIGSNPPKITIIDPDDVDLNNPNRQNFNFTDVGYNKAMALAVRYSAKFGLPIAFSSARVTPSNISKIINDQGKTLIIEAVDKKYVRKDIYDFVQNNHNVDWISLGNTKDSGQLTFYCFSLGLERSVVDVFPNDFEYAALEEERKKDNNQSCAENTIKEPQSLAINKEAANKAVNFFYQMLYERSITYDIVFFDRFNNSRTIKLDEQVFKKVQTEDIEKFKNLFNKAI